MLRGIALFDANGDSLTDIYLTHDNRPPLMDSSNVARMKLGNTLFLNLGTNEEGLPRFLEVGAEAGVQEQTRKSHGAAIADYDNDGRLDIYVVNGVDGLITDDEQEMPPGYQRSYGSILPGEGRNTLLHNDGNTLVTLPSGQEVAIPRFSDRTEGAGVGDGRESAGAVWADIDRDGYVDLYVNNLVDSDYYFVRYPGIQLWNALGERNTLYRNNGDGTFTDITEAAGVGGKPRPNPVIEGSMTGRILTVDEARLTELAEVGVTLDWVRANHALFFDYDDDAFPDLFIANDGDPIEVYHNEGDLTFTDVTEFTGLNIHGFWMEIGLWDYNGDGRMDLYVTNTGSGAYGNVVWHDGQLLQTKYNGLFRNDGMAMADVGGARIPVPKFTYVSAETPVDWSETLPPQRLTVSPTCHPGLDPAHGLELGEFGWGAVFPDIDNDGDPDLYWVGGLRRGNPFSPERLPQSPGRLLRNDGVAGFIDISVEARVLNLMGVDYTTGERIDLGYGEIGGGLAMGDLNGDGFADILVSNDADYTPYGHDPPGAVAGDELVQVPTFLFLNPGGDNSWLKVRLEGTVSNRAAIGARVRVFLDDGRTLVKYLLSHDVTSGQNSFELLFGVGQSEVRMLEVRWPSGNVEILNNVPINETMHITEGADESA
jgi:hypothetical protein